MAIKKKLLVFGLLILSARALPGQWRDEVAQLFRKGNDPKAIAEYLLSNFDALEAADKPDATGILAFCFGRQNDTKNEIHWIVEYFDAHGARDTGFTFLDLVSQADIIDWLSLWKSRYPFIVEIALIKGIGDQVIIPQGVLPLVIDITNEAFYKFSLGKNVLEGGQFKPGFNVIGLDANELFISPGKRLYVLEVKSAGLILKKEITLDIEVVSPPRPPTPAMPGNKPLEYSLALYVGGELVMLSKKVENPVSWKVDVKPNTLPYGFKPDYVLRRDQPDPMNSFSILNAIGIIYSLLKDLLKKKDKKEAEPPKIQTVQDLALVFKQKDMTGLEQETRISIKLRTKNLPYVLTAP
jgi:hypothetical protein